MTFIPYILLTAVLLTVASSALAQPAFDSPFGQKGFEDILKGIANFVAKVGVPVISFFLILSGFMFVTAQGNTQKLERAKLMFYWTLVGTAIVVGAKPIAEMVINFAQSL
jgi:hypothetical protein